MTPPEIKPATSKLLVRCLNQLRHRLSQVTVIFVMIEEKKTAINQQIKNDSDDNWIF
jgi:hypothetical protein